MKLIKRKNYTDTLWKLKDMDLIKVITGMRRAGKSTLLKMFREELVKEISPNRIQHYNFETRENYNRAWTEIYDEVQSKLIKGKTNYIFMDEIQNVSEFERLADGLFVNPDVDLYITGSNAYLLSSELATLLTGRYFSINVLPFSLAEFAQTYENYRSGQEKFQDYFAYSSLPKAVGIFHADPSLVDSYVKDVYDTVLENDIFTRHKIIKEQTFENVTKFALDNISNMVSPNSIANSLTQINKTVNSRTVDDYLHALTESYILYKAERFDLRGKNILTAQEKYYVADIGLRNALLGRGAENDVGRVLENIVYLELLRRGNQVWIGKVGDREIDFVALSKNRIITYYQVAYTVRDEATLKRELDSFDMIKDHNLKVLLTMDIEEPIRNGVRQLNVCKWLLGESSEMKT